MRVSKRLFSSRLCVLAAGLAIASCSATGGESIDRVGRLFGYGYSDGYHACGADCYHVGENLPPHSFAYHRSLYSSPAPRLAAHNHAVSAKANCSDCDANWLPPDWDESNLVPQPVVDSGVLPPSSEIVPKDTTRLVPQVMPESKTDSQELPAPKVEPPSASDADSAMVKPTAAQSHPVRISAKTPARLPQTTR